MRNIIFTSFIGLAALPVAADVPFGCYVRDYSAAHLASNPAQIVESMALKVYRDPTFGEVVADLGVLFSNQGRLKGKKSAGQFMDQWLICWERDNLSGCSVECDGGSFWVTRDTGDSLTIETKGLWVGDVEGCGGAETIAETPGKSVKYKLNRADDLQCVWN